MSSEFIQAALKERARLLGELNNLPIYKQFLAIDSYISSLKEQKPQISFKFSSNNSVRDKELITKKDKIIKLATDCIISNGGNAHVRVIREYLQSNNIELPEASLSAYLSANKHIFQSDRVKGWGLQPAPQMNTADVVASAVGEASQPQIITTSNIDEGGIYGS